MKQPRLQVWIGDQLQSLSNIPPWMEENSIDIERGQYMVVMIAQKGFAKYVSKVVWRWHLFNSNSSRLHQVARCHISIWLTLLWSLVFLVNAIAPWLSPLIKPGVVYSTSTLLNQLCIQTICCVHWDIVTYSALTVDNATVVWHLLLHVTGLPDIINTYPEVDLQVSLHPQMHEERFWNLKSRSIHSQLYFWYTVAHKTIPMFCCFG